MKKLLIALVLTFNFITVDAATGQPDRVVGSYKVGSKKFKARSSKSVAEISGYRQAFLLNISLEAENDSETGIQFMIFDPVLGVDYELFSLADENFDIVLNGNVAGINYQEYKRSKGVEITKNLDELEPVLGYLRLESVDKNGILTGYFEFDSRMQVKKYSERQSSEEPYYKKLLVHDGEFQIKLCSDSLEEKRLELMNLNADKLSEVFEEVDLGATKIKIQDIAN